MPTVTIWGRLYPAIAAVKIQNAPKITSIIGDLRTEVEIRCDGHNVEITCNTNCEDPIAHTQMLVFQAHSIVSQLITILVFNSGIALTLTMDTINFPDGTFHHLVHSDPSLARLCTAYTVPKNKQQFDAKSDGSLLQIQELVASNKQLYLSFTDLALSLTHPDQALVSCARAIEGIRNMICPDDRMEGWPRLREMLNVDKSYLKRITDASKGPRHGDIKNDPKVDVFDIRRRAWAIADRYLEFLKRDGTQPLCAPEFTEGISVPAERGFGLLDSQAAAYQPYTPETACRFLPPKGDRVET